MHESLSAIDRFEITQVLARYGHVIDGRLLPSLSEIFTADASFDVTSVGGPVYSGIDGIADFVRLNNVHPPFHTLTNAWVYEEAGQVRSLSKWLTPDAATGLPRSGDYFDTWRRTGEGWRITARIARLRWAGGGWAPTQPR